MERVAFAEHIGSRRDLFNLKSFERKEFELTTPDYHAMNSGTSSTIVSQSAQFFFKRGGFQKNFEQNH